MSDDTFEKIKTKYGISSDDPQAIISEIRKQIKKTHPDTNHENFESVDDFSSEEEWQKFQDYVKDLQCIENLKKGNNLVPYTDIKEIIEKSNATALARYKELNMELIKSTEYENAKRLLSDDIDKSVEKIKYSNLIPKISISGLTVFLPLIWFLPSSIESHPILSKFIDIQSSFFLITWIYVLLITGLFWIVTFRTEKCQTKILKKLNDEFFQRSCLTHFLAERKLFANEELSEDNLFSKATFVNYVLYYVYSIASRTNIGNCSPKERELIQFSRIDFERLRSEIDLTMNGSITLEDFAKYDLHGAPVTKKGGRTEFPEKFQLKIFDIFFGNQLISNLNDSLDAQTLQNFVNASLSRAEVSGLVELVKTNRIYDEIYRVKIEI